MAAGKRKKRRMKLFYPIYSILMVAAVVAILIGCGQLADVLAGYEASLPKYVAEDVAQMFLSRNFELVYSYQDPAQFAGEDSWTYAKYMNEFTKDGELTWSESHSTGEAEKTYAVRLDGKRMFEFTLVKTGTQDTNGYDEWTLGEIRTLGVTASTRTVQALTDATVYVDNVPLNETQIIERGIFLEEEEYLLGDEAKSPEMCVYEYDVCFGTPEIRVVNADGTEAEVTMDENGNAVASISSSDHLKQRVEERVIEIVQAFARFTSEDLSQYNMLKLVRKGTEGYEKIEDFDNNWFGRHDGYDFQNMVTDNYIQFSDDTFACDIHFDYIIEYDDADDVVYNTHYRFYFVERSDEWYLYDFKMVNE